MPMGAAFNTSESVLNSLKIHKIILLIQSFCISVGATYVHLRAWSGSWFCFVTVTQQMWGISAVKFFCDATKITYAKHFQLWNNYSTRFEWEGCVCRVWRVFCVQTGSLTLEHRHVPWMGTTFWSCDASAWLPLGFALRSCSSMFTLCLYWLTPSIFLEQANQFSL